jgi:hypothetical protein
LRPLGVSISSLANGVAHFSAPIRDKPADLARRRKDHISAVAHHTGWDESRRTLLRTFVANVRLEPQISLPEVAAFSVRGGHLGRCRRNGYRLHAILRVELLEIRHRRLAQQCLDLLASISDPETRVALRERARTWTRLAEEYETPIARGTASELQPSAQQQQQVKEPEEDGK